MSAQSIRTFTALCCLMVWARISPACAATAQITFFKVTKQYNPSFPFTYMGDKVEWEYSASWTTEGLQCHADVASWDPSTQTVGTFLHHQDYLTSPVANSGTTSVTPGASYRAHINVWGPGSPSRIIYAADTQVEAPQ